MKKLFLIISLVCLLYGALSADELSPRRAVLGSLLIPGYGQFYTGNLTKAGLHLTADLLIFAAYFRLGDEINNYTSFYKNYAEHYAGVQGKKPDYYYQMIQNYKSSDDYNSEIILAARNWFLIYQNNPDAYYAYLDRNLIKEDDFWEWENQSSWNLYRKKRNDKQQMEIYRNFAIGALFLNRFISIIDATVSIRRANRENTVISNFSFIPDFNKNTIILNYQHRF